MVATLYFSILLGPLLCNVVCEKETLHSKIALINNVQKFEINPLFYNENYSSTEAVDRDEILVVENGDSILSLVDDSTLRSSSDIEENLEESDGGGVVGDDFETNEGVFEILSDEDNTDSLKQVQRKKKLRDFIKIKGKQKFNKYSRLNAVKEIFPLQKKSRSNNNKLSEEESEKEESKKEGSVEEVSDEEEWFSNENIPSQEQGRLLKSTRNRTVNHFLCRTENVKDSVIVHDARAWTFETQDVNLTLTYPLAKTRTLDWQYIITGFSVLLVTDGVDSRGYINSGGILSDNISLSFISPGISSVLYEFQVYGIPRYSSLDVDLLSTLFYLCS